MHSSVERVGKVAYFSPCRPDFGELGGIIGNTVFLQWGKLLGKYRRVKHLSHTLQSERRGVGLSSTLFRFPDHPGS